MKKLQKGFTLIELLVVIAIIGILSAVVLASLNSARDKGADAAVKASLANARAQAELYYDANTGSYDNGTEDICAVDLPSGQKSIKDNVDSAKLAAGLALTATTLDGGGALGQPTCNDTADGWAAEVPLKTAGSGLWCVDSTGISQVNVVGSGLADGTDVTCN